MGKSLDERVMGAVRVSHQRLQAHLTEEPLFFIPWYWVEKYLIPLTKTVYKMQPHWHLWDGKCISSIPFELRMATLATFCTAWYYEIMLRKARDRHSPGARQSTEEWRACLGHILDIIREDIDHSRDEAAEKRHQDTARPVNKLKHWINTRLWGH